MVVVQRENGSFRNHGSGRILSGKKAPRDRNKHNEGRNGCLNRLQRTLTTAI
jgi:hypothetical protein